MPNAPSPVTAGNSVSDLVAPTPASPVNAAAASATTAPAKAAPNSPVHVSGSGAPQLLLNSIEQTLRRLEVDYAAVPPTQLVQVNMSATPTRQIVDHGEVQQLVALYQAIQFHAMLGNDA